MNGAAAGKAIFEVRPTTPQDGAILNGVGEKVTVQADVIIAADGAGSHARSLVQQMV